MHGVADGQCVVPPSVTVLGVPAVNHKSVVEITINDAVLDMDAVTPSGIVVAVVSVVLVMHLRYNSRRQALAACKAERYKHY